MFKELQPMNRKREMILAVDGGATKTVALVYDEVNLKLRGVGLSGPTNLTSVSRKEVISNIKLSVSKACEEAGIKIEDLKKGIFGIAGIGDSPSMTEFGKKVISESMGRKDFQAMNDGRPAYEMANMGSDGIVFAGGTGSVAFFKIGNSLERRGGWNWFAGDNASASWIAKKALNLATLEYDGIIQGTELIKSVETYFGMEFTEAVSAVLFKQNKSYISGFAPIITKLALSGSKPANDILEECADYVVNLVESILPRFNNSPRISLVGGTMLAGDIYTRRIQKRLNRKIFVYFGYQVAIGGILILFQQLGIECGFVLRDDILNQMEELLNRKSKAELSKYLFIERGN